MMSNQNILKRLKQRFGQKEDYDVDRGTVSVRKKKTNIVGKGVRLKGYIKVHAGQDSLSDTETVAHTGSRTGYHIRLSSQPKSTNSSPSTAHKIKNIIASPKANNKSIVATSTTKVIQPPAYACCVNRVKIIDNCCGRTEHNIVYHQHHPIVGVSNAGDLASALTEQTVVDISDSQVRHSATTSRVKTLPAHCKRCCTCSKQRQLQTLPTRSKRPWKSVVLEKCVECEREKMKDQMGKQKSLTLKGTRSKQKASMSSEQLICTCGLSDIQDNMKNRALEKANSVDNSLCSGSTDTECKKEALAEETKALASFKSTTLQEDETAAMLLDEPSYICSPSQIKPPDNHLSEPNGEGPLSPAEKKTSGEETSKDLSFSDDENRWIGNSSSGYCTQSDDCTDTSSNVTLSSEGQKFMTSEQYRNTYALSNTEITKEEFVDKVPFRETANTNPIPPSSLCFSQKLKDTAARAMTPEKEVTPPPIPERKYRTNSFYKRQQLMSSAASLSTDYMDIDESVTLKNSTGENSSAIDDKVEDNCVKVSPPLLTKRTEWPAPPPPLDEALSADPDKADNDVDKDEGLPSDEPIHMTMEEVWQDAQHHGIPLQKPTQCDRTYSTPDIGTGAASDCIRGISVPNSITTPPHDRLDLSSKQKLFVDLSTKCDYPSQEMSLFCGASGSQPSPNMSTLSSKMCGGICMVDGPALSTQNYHTMPAAMPSTSTGASNGDSEIPPMLPPKSRNRPILTHGGGLCNIVGDITSALDDVTHHTGNGSLMDQFVDSDSECSADFVDSLRKLKDCGWYWGPLSWVSADAKLANKPDGSFLVRDSSDDRYILSLSFRTQGKTHHTRIEHFKGTFSFYSQPKSHGAGTIIEFIEKAMEHSSNGKFLYFLRPPAQGLPPAPVQLLYPVSRFRLMQSLQHLCRFSILRCTRYDHIDFLPLPPKIKFYLKESQYYTEYLQDDQYMSTVTGQPPGQYTSNVIL